MLKTIAAALVMTVAGAGTAGATTLDSERWQKRIVIVFAGTAETERVEEQADILLADEAGLSERDLLAFTVVGDSLRPIFGTLPAGETAEGLRRRFAVAADAGFSALLIGKDGGVKWRGDTPVTKDALFALIDAMPMRRGGR